MKGGALQRQRRPLRPSKCRRMHSDQRQRNALPDFPGEAHHLRGGFLIAERGKWEAAR